MFAYYIDHFSPFILGPWHGIGIRWYGSAYVAAFLLGIWMLRAFARHGYSELPEEKVADFIAATALFGVLLGGRLGYVLFYDLEGVLHDPLQFFRVWEGGMASHGGILGIVLFTLWYARRHKVSWLGLGDNLVVAAPLGIFFGRCANFINGELFGRATHVPWAVQFPKELFDLPALAQRAIDACSALDPALTNTDAIVDAAQTSAPVRAVLAGILTPRHPSQLYEAGMEGLLLFVLLWFIRTRTRVAEGVTTGAFFVLYALLRILGEQFRQPDVGIAFTLGLTRGQFLSLFMILFGVALIWHSVRRNRPAPRPAL
ncbi:MAG: prolipoprotein diacylglyceryl transferase [Verrucomicrobiota bacterium]